MGFRGALVRARGLFAWRALGVSPAPQSVLRAEPWLFFKDERVIDDFRRVYPFSLPELDRWRITLDARRDWLAKRGIRYLIVIPPNKETVYAEAVPSSYTRQPGPSRLSQLGTYLKGTSTVEFLDLSSAIESHKASGRLYQLTDTHWNDLGAFVGYRSIVERLAPWFPGLRPLAWDDIVQTTVITRGGDLARICGLQVDLREPQIQIGVRPTATHGAATSAEGSQLAFERIDVRGQMRFTTKTDKGEISSAVILRDSFGEALIPFLSRHFRTAEWIWTYDFPADLIDERRPALVIEQLVERKLMVLTPVNPPALAY